MNKKMLIGTLVLVAAIAVGGIYMVGQGKDEVAKVAEETTVVEKEEPKAEEAEETSESTEEATEESVALEEKQGIVVYDNSLAEDGKTLSEEYIDTMTKTIKKVSGEILGKTEEEIKDVLGKYAGQDNVYYVYYCTEENGAMALMPETPLPDGYDGRLRPWYIGAKENNVHVSEIYTDAATGDMIVSIAATIKENDKLLGVVGMDHIIGNIPMEVEIVDNSTDSAEEPEMPRVPEQLVEEGKALVSELKGAVIGKNDEEALEILDTYSKKENVVYAYYAKATKEMFLRPEEQLPGDYDPTTRPWYTEAVANGVHVTDAYVEAGTGKMIFTVSTSVYDGETLLGVVSLDVFIGQ